MILIFPGVKAGDIEDISNYPHAGWIVKCNSVEEALALLAKNRLLDPVVTFAPTADVLDKIIVDFQSGDRRTLVVICGAMEDREISVQSYLVEACRSLVAPAKDGAD